MPDASEIPGLSAEFNKSPGRVRRLKYILTNFASSVGEAPPAPKVRKLRTIPANFGSDISNPAPGPDGVRKVVNPQTGFGTEFSTPLVNTPASNSEGLKVLNNEIKNEESAQANTDESSKESTSEDVSNANQANTKGDHVEPDVQPQAQSIAERTPLTPSVDYREYTDEEYYSMHGRAAPNLQPNFSKLDNFNESTQSYIPLVKNPYIPNDANHTPQQSQSHTEDQVPQPEQAPSSNTKDQPTSEEQLHQKSETSQADTHSNSEQQFKNELQTSIQNILDKLNPDLTGVVRLGEEVKLSESDLDQINDCLDQIEPKLNSVSELQEVVRMINELKVKDKAFGIALFFNNAIKENSQITDAREVKTADDIKLELPPNVYKLWLASKNLNNARWIVVNYRLLLANGKKGNRIYGTSSPKFAEYIQEAINGLDYIQSSANDDVNNEN